MEKRTSSPFYTSPSSMNPLFPEGEINKLEDLAVELIEKSAKLSGKLNPITRAALAEFFRPMNSYYSNLIEGHDTHPIDIDRALNNDYSKNKEKRDLQYEAKAHINVHQNISRAFFDSNTSPIPTSSNFLKFIHADFYNNLPDDFKKSKTLDGNYKTVVPGDFRNCEVKVGNHVAPHSESLTSFMERFESFYNPNEKSNSSKVRRIISIAASHHRLAWIHPFLDGNGRVVRLCSDACFMYENLNMDGLWSISRALARTKENYMAKLANADLVRRNDHDGRGNLSNKMLVDFCAYFLESAIDQIDFMYKMLDIESMLVRIEKMVELLVVKNKLKIEAKYLLTEVFLKGRISKQEAMRITNTSDKTLKKTIDTLTQYGLLKSKLAGTKMLYYVNYSIKFSPLLFPGLYPSHKEIDMMIDID